MPNTKPDNTERDRAIVAKHRLGMTHEAPAAEYGMSRVRVGQDIKAAKPRPPGEAERALPSDAEQAKRFWDGIYERAQHPGSAPTGRQVIDAIHNEIMVGQVNKQLENSPIRADDRRAARSVHGPPQRSYMQV